MIMQFKSLRSRGLSGLAEVRREAGLNYSQSMNLAKYNKFYGQIGSNTFEQGSHNGLVNHQHFLDRFNAYSTPGHNATKGQSYN